MPRIKDVAARLLADGWDISPAAFETLWAECRKIQLQTHQGAMSPGTRVLPPALAAVGTSTRPYVVAVILLAQADQQLANDPSLEEIQRTLVDLGASWGQQGLAKRLVMLSDTAFPPATSQRSSSAPPALVPRPVATIFTHDQPDGFEATRQERDTWLTKISSVIIFIRHELNLPYGYKGELYLNAGDGSTGLDVEVPKLQYNILRHLLRHQAAKAKRTLPAIMEACWRNEPEAVRQAAALQRGTDKPNRNYDTAITKLSKILQTRCGIFVQSSQTGIYDFQPPPTYCLIEED